MLLSILLLLEDSLLVDVVDVEEEHDTCCSAFRGDGDGCNFL